MKKSPYKSKISKVLDPAGVFNKGQVKYIMNEGDMSAFKMKGFPQHAGVSPMKQETEYPNMVPEVEVINPGPSVPRKGTQGAPLAEPTIEEETYSKSKHGKYQKKSLTVSSKDTKSTKSTKAKSFKPRPNLKDLTEYYSKKLVDFSPGAVGYKGEIGTLGLSMAVNKLFVKKDKKKSTGILSGKWKKIM